MLNKKLIVKQNGFKDCGASCLLSIMKYYGCEASHEEVTFTLKTGVDGTNAYNIINGSRLYGFDGYGIHYTYEEIINSEVSFPIICHVIKNNMYHFIVVYKVNKNSLTIMDPGSNITKMTFDEFKKIYQETSLVIYPVKKVNNLVNKNKLLDVIIDYLKLEKKNLIMIISTSTILIILSILINYFTLIIIDYILPNYNYSLLIKITISFLITSIIKNIINYIRGKLIIKVNSKLTINLNNNIIKKLFNLPYQFFKNKSTPEVISRINDLKEFKDSFSEIIINISTNILLVFISFILLLKINIKLFIIYIIEISIYILITLIYKNKNNKHIDEILINESNYNKTLNDSIYSYEINKNLNLNNNTLKNIEISYIKNDYSHKIYDYSMNFQILLKELISNLTYIISLFISTICIHKNIMTLGNFLLFNSLIYYFTEPLKNILELEPNINYLKNIYRRINDLLLVSSEETNKTDKIIRGNIVIKNLYYLVNEKELFSNVSFKIKYGSKFLIYGNSGNGKSTIIKILLKYLNDYKGNIFIDNKNIKDIDSNIISNSMTYVSQNNFILNDTLRNNIIYGRRINDEEYERVIHICNLDTLRNSNKLRNNMIIEEDGFNISGGERQKIILARSILKDSEFIILDEALSEIGVEEEKEIIKKLFNYFKEKTIIYISHKQEIIEMFNEKYKLERSKA
ncbi:MAG: ATP-binding cassette domain-containing protein [Mollicutes bacterium]|nr:ATP-binding cassette domain-containing protein [Mollicutes bacterium]